jgi:hypothetical protein
MLPEGWAALDGNGGLRFAIPSCEEKMGAFREIRNAPFLMRLKSKYKIWSWSL